jgi:arylsulfatase A-like enzyme
MSHRVTAHGSRRRPGSAAPVLCLIGATFMTTSSPSSDAGEPKRRPNVVILVADDLGYGDLGCYGSKDLRTPHLDRLAKAGVRLTDAYANAAVCSPTRAALITGRYPQRSGFEWVVDYGQKDFGLPASPTSLPRLLKDAGYRTALFGKWHLGYRDEWAPNAHGFDEFFGFLAADLDYYAHTEATGDPGLYENTKPVEKKGYLTDLFTDRAVEFIGENAKHPFFLEVAYNAPHWPFQAPGRPDDVRAHETYGPKTGTRADYVKMVEHLDAEIGRVLQAIDDRGLAEDTLVVFFSDNGGERLSDNGPLFHGKYTLWEGGIRVPMIVRWPRAIPGNTTSAQAVITTDVTASALAAAGVAPPKDPQPDGEDVVPILAGKKPPHERTFFWRMVLPGDESGQKAVRRGKWKYVLDRRTELLFDLEADVGERTNRAYRDPKVVAELRDALKDWEAGLPPAKRH